MSGFGGKGKKRTSLSERLEISQSRARIATLIGQYEEIEMEGEELSLSLREEGAFDEMGKLKDTVMTMVMDFKMEP
eukprot:scaffold26527_cov69-Phaeocystis_antarctica.AAC.4